jgi:hypothetical protein
MRLLYEHIGMVVTLSIALGIAAVIENYECFRDNVLCGG